MKLALRKDAPAGATLWQRFTCWVIKARLASQYCHGGIVIDGTLYHITSADGPHTLGPGQWSPERWVLIDFGGDDALAKVRFYDATNHPQGPVKRWVWHAVKGYDWVSLLAFAGITARVRWLHYCFELVWFMRTGQAPKFRVTPEMLILLSKLNTTSFVDFVRYAKGVLRC